MSTKRTLDKAIKACDSDFTVLVLHKIDSAVKFAKSYQEGHNQGIKNMAYTRLNEVEKLIDGHNNAMEANQMIKRFEKAKQYIDSITK